MDKKEKTYEPPRAKIYRFDEDDRILTASGGVDLIGNYAANALNLLFEGTSTTIEK